MRSHPIGGSSRHDSVIRSLLRAYSGRVVKTTGDGVLATFDGPSRAVVCARHAHIETAEIGLTIRAGLANAGETIASRTVKDVVVGSGFAFGDAGEHSLEGVEDT